MYELYWYEKNRVIFTYFTLFVPLFHLLLLLSFHLFYLGCMISEVSYGSSLNLIIVHCFCSLTHRISPGIDELVKKLQAKNTNVYLISGGFRQMINVCHWSAECHFWFVAVVFILFSYASKKKSRSNKYKYRLQRRSLQ